MPSPDERVRILDQVNTLATSDLVDTWRGAAALPNEDFRSLIVDAVPQIVEPYAQMAGELATDWYVEAAPEVPFQPVTAPMPDPEQLAASADWALKAAGDMALGRFAGFMQRAIFDAARDTMVANAESEPGARWVRHARPNACAFCRMLATRTDSGTYTSKEAATSVVGRGKAMSTAERRVRARGESRISGRFIAGGQRTRGSRGLGERYHDYCRCTAVEVRPGQVYLPPDYVKKWEEQYIDAVRATTGDGAIDTKAVLSYMRQAESGAAPAARAVTRTAAASRADDTAAWLTAEAEYKAAVTEWLDAEQEYIRTRTPVKLTEEQGRTRGRETWQSYAESVAPDDAAAVRIYTGNSYEVLNGALRSDDLATLTRAQRQSIDDIDRVIAAAPRVPENVTVARAVGADVFGLTADSDISSVVGRSFRDDAYVSTALQSKQPSIERYEVEVRLDVPAGTRALYVSSHEATDPRALAVYGTEENELLIGRGIDFEAIDAFVEDGNRVIVARITGQDGGGA